MRFGLRFVALALGVTLLPVLPSMPLPVTAGSSAKPSGSPVLVRTIRETPTRAYGAARPSGLVWSPDLRVLLVGAGRRVVRLTADGRSLGAARLGEVPVTGTLTVDPRDGTTSLLSGRRLVTYAAGALRRAQPNGRSAPLRLPVRDVRGATYDARGVLVVLDGSELVRRARDGRVVRTAIRGSAGHDLVGLTRWAGLDLLFTYDRDTGLVLGVDRRGNVTRRFDLTRVGVRAATGLAIAPSADRTDHPSTRSLYVADAGTRTTPGRVLEVSLTTATAPAVTAAAVSGTLVRSVRTSTFSPPSPDPSGIAYLPDRDRLLISDGEVDEMAIFDGVNLFETTRTGTQTRNGVSQPWSNEPTGVGYNPANRHALVSDDSHREIYDVAAGPDGTYGSGDDTVTHFDTAASGNGDPEDVTWDPVTGSVWTIDGVNTQVYRYRAGADGLFGTADDLRSNFDVGAYGAMDPEGIEYDSARDTLVVLDDGSNMIYEVDRTGSLLNTVTTTAASMRKAAGITVAPGSSDATARHYYLVDRGVDNDNNPSENDGMLFELAAALPPVGPGTNQAPVVDAGPDLSVALPASATLDGSVSDDGLPNPPGATTVTWSRVSGPGSVTFANPAAVDTTASFSAAGTYVLRLTASDGQATGVDDVTVTVQPAGGTVTTVEVSVASGSDDAEQRPSGGVDLTSSDLELVTDGTTVQRVGLRFPGLQIPAGASISRAWIQFQTDEISTDTATLTLRAQAADNAATYLATNNNLGSRPLTSASVPWNPPAWNTVGARGTAQQTPDISSLVQAVVNRSGWAAGNALAIQVTGTGRRTAEAFEGTFAPLLHVEWQ